MLSFTSPKLQRNRNQGCINTLRGLITLSCRCQLVFCLTNLWLEVQRPSDVISTTFLWRLFCQGKLNRRLLFVQFQHHRRSSSSGGNTTPLDNPPSALPLTFDRLSSVSSRDSGFVSAGSGEAVSFTIGEQSTFKAPIQPTFIKVRF